MKQGDTPQFQIRKLRERVERIEEERHFLRGAVLGLARVIVCLAPENPDAVQEIVKWKNDTEEFLRMRMDKPPSAGPVPKGDVPQARGAKWAYAAIIEAGQP